MKILEARGLVKRKQGQLVINNVQFDVNEGEIFVVLGARLSGKSMLLKLIYGEENLDSGDIIIDQLNMKNDLLRIRKQLGIVQQRDVFDSEIPALESLALHASLYGIPFREAKIKARDSLRMLELDEQDEGIVGGLGSNLVKYLLLARALMTDPKLIILDEPTVGMSLEGRQRFLQITKKLKAAKKTVIWATNSLPEAELLADRVILLDKGAICAEGSPHDLVSSLVGREVVEFPIERDEIDYHLQKIRSRFEYQIAKNRLRIFVPANFDGHRLMSELALPEVQLRKAHLEDVALKLLGHRMEGLQ